MTDIKSPSRPSTNSKPAILSREHQSRQTPLSAASNPAIHPTLTWSTAKGPLIIRPSDTISRSRSWVVQAGKMDPYLCFLLFNPISSGQGSNVSLSRSGCLFIFTRAGLDITFYSWFSLQAFIGFTCYKIECQQSARNEVCESRGLSWGSPWGGGTRLTRIYLHLDVKLKFLIRLSW